MNSETLNIFKAKILKFIRPTANSVFGCHNPTRIKLLTRIRFWLSHFHFQHFAVAEKKLKMLLIFSLHVPITLTKDRPSWAKLKNISPNILEITNPEIIQFFLYGDQDFIVSTNSIILKSTTEYILSTKRFDEPPFLY